MAQNDTLQPAAPAFLIDGTAKQQLSDDLLSLSIAENTDGLYRCEATFSNWGESSGKIDFLYFKRDVIEFGKALEVKLGPDTLFEGRITAVEAHFLEGRPPEVTVLAEDRLQDLRMTRRTRTFVDSSDSDVMRQIAGDHGLQTDINVNGPTHKVLAQTNMSDLAFLRERARAVDAELWMKGKTMVAKLHTGRNQATVSLSYGNQLRAFSVAADLARQCTAISVSGWDVSAKNTIAFDGAEAAINGELNGDASGASILKSKFGERKQALAHTVPMSSAEARTQAEAAFRQIARRFVVGHGIAQTTADLRVGAFVKLDNIGPLFNGKYYVSESQHVFDRTNGLRTKFTGERPGLGR